MPQTETVQGLQALLDSMDGMVSLVARKSLLVRALRKGAALILKLAQRLAPRDPKTPGDRIPDSMKISIRQPTATYAVAEIGPTGSGFVGIFAEKGTKKQRARPWLAPAFDQKVGEAYRVLGETILDEMEHEFYRRPS